jgi:hypothetical protein
MFHGSTVFFLPWVPWKIVTGASHGLVERIVAWYVIDAEDPIQSNAEDL